MCVCLSEDGRLCVSARCGQFARCTSGRGRTKVDLTKYVEYHKFAFDEVLSEVLRRRCIYTYIYIVYV